MVYQSENNASYVKMNSAAIKTDAFNEFYEKEGFKEESLCEGGTFSVAHAVNIPSQEKGKYMLIHREKIAWFAI